MLSAEQSGLAQRIFWIDRYVFDLDGVPLQGNSSGNGPTTWSERMVLHERPKFRRRPESCCRPILFALAKEDECHFSLAQPRGGFDKGVQYGLQIKRRTANDLEHVRGRRLLLQRFGKLARARLHFLEQANVLDGDDGLVGEGS